MEYWTVLEVICGMNSEKKHAIINGVVLETRVLISRRLEDKNESLGLG